MVKNSTLIRPPAGLEDHGDCKNNGVTPILEVAPDD